MTWPTKYSSSALRDVIRGELEHLIVLNANAFELQHLLHEKMLLINNGRNQSRLEVEKTELALKDLLDSEHDSIEGLDELSSRIVTNYKLLQEENKQLRKERQAWNEVNIKSLL